MTAMTDDPTGPSVARTCPSAPAQPGATLLGMVGADGRVHHLRTALVVDEDFIARARRQGPPEARMRFAHTCVEGKCQQWTGHSCGVAEMVLQHLAVIGHPDAGTGLPACTIRATCRWYDQSGTDACRACSFVVTDSGPIAAE
jgi:hypothetical protein